MAKRRKLEAPSADDLTRLEAEFQRDTPLKGPMSAPIAQVAADTAQAADLRSTEERAEAARNRTDAERLREKHDELEASREEVLREARQQAASLAQKMEGDLREEMEARRRTWEGHLEDEKEAFAARLRQRAGQQVLEIVGRVLRDYAGGNIAGQVAGLFVDRLTELDEEARDKLKAAARRAGGARRRRPHS